MSGMVLLAVLLLQLASHQVASFRLPPPPIARVNVASRRSIGPVMATAGDALPGIGDDGCRIASPSGINTLPESSQAAIVAGILASLFAGTYALVSAFDAAAAAFPLVESWKSTFALLGPVFIAAGGAHFKLKDDFMNMMPAQGAWGIWYLPGSKYFHVAWTGVAELALGTGLTAGYASNLLKLGLPQETVPLSAAGLFLLTILVSPANIYMYTHGAKLPMEGPEVPVAFHAVRGFFQILLLTQFFELAKPLLL